MIFCSLTIYILMIFGLFRSVLSADNALVLLRDSSFSSSSSMAFDHSVPSLAGHTDNSSSNHVGVVESETSPIQRHLSRKLNPTESNIAQHYMSPGKSTSLLVSRNDTATIIFHATETVSTSVQEQKSSESRVTKEGPNLKKSNLKRERGAGGMKKKRDKKEQKAMAKRHTKKKHLKTRNALPKLQSGMLDPAIDGQATNMRPQNAKNPINVVCGAIQAVLAHPTNPGICFAGAVNGGVWRTTSCTSAVPHWIPLTDSEESLSVGDMVFDLEDKSHKTVVVAVGTRSSLAFAGGMPLGMLYTNNIMARQPSWKVLDNADGPINFRKQKLKFNSIFVRGRLMLASSYDNHDTQSFPALSLSFIREVCKSGDLGIFRSTDQGRTWYNVFRGIGYAIAADPNDDSRFFAVLDFVSACGGDFDNGIFMSNDTGATWYPTTVVNVVPEGNLSNAKLSVSAQGSRVWAGLVENGQESSILYSDDVGATWTLMDKIRVKNAGSSFGLNPNVEDEEAGGQGYVHFSLLSNPKNRDEVYVAGDRQASRCEVKNVTCWPNSIGAVDFTGIVFRGNASAPSQGNVLFSDQWQHMTDKRNAGFVGGGTASSSAPHADSRDMEFRADGYIINSNDGGVAVRSSPGSNAGDWFGICGNLQAFETYSVAYEPLNKTVMVGNQDTGTIVGVLGESNTAISIAVGDGNTVMIDYLSNPDNFYFYFGVPEYQYGSFIRLEVNKAGNGVPTETLVNIPDGYKGDLISVTAMNPSNRAEFIVVVHDDIGYFHLAHTIDRGISFKIVHLPVVPVGPSAASWSHDGKYLYVVDAYVGSTYRCSKKKIAGKLFCEVVGAQIGNGQYVRDLVVNATNNQILYAIAVYDIYDFRQPRVYRSTDGGARWKDITGRGSLLDEAYLGGALAFISKNGVSSILVGTSSGILMRDDDGAWKQIATGLPAVAVMDMLYSAEDDRLVIATLGRGLWYLEEVSKVVQDIILTNRRLSKVQTEDVEGQGKKQDVFAQHHLRGVV